MKKNLFLLFVMCLALSACVPAIFQTDPTSPAPTVIEEIAQPTEEIIPQPLPSATLAPTNTAIIVPSSTITPTEISPTPTETQNPVLLTLTATLGMGAATTDTQTPASTATSGTGTIIANAEIVGTATRTPSPTATGTLYPQHYGTMPPNLPSGTILLLNRSRTEVYISLQCTTSDGYTTIIEYPVGSKVKTQAPAGRYIYVAWVGGNKIVGKFKLDRFQDLTLTIYKDRVEIK